MHSKLHRMRQRTFHWVCFGVRKVIAAAFFALAGTKAYIAFFNEDGRQAALCAGVFIERVARGECHFYYLSYFVFGCDWLDGRLFFPK